jgi:hypothetical protein
MAKSFDAKEFLLHKGERLGLFVALVIMIGLVGLGGANGFALDPPAKTVEVIRDKADTIERRLVIDPAAPEPPLDDLFTKTDVIGIRVKADDYVVATPFFRDTPLENRKRTNPVVLTPVEFNPVLVRGAVQSLMISIQQDQVRMGVLIPLDKSKAQPVLTPEQQRWQALMKQRADWLAQMGMIRPGGGVGPAVPGGVPGVGAEAGPTTEYRLDWVDATKIPANAEPATTITPVRMAVVSGSFPYRQQLEVFRAAMRKESIAELAKEGDGELLPRFLRFQVERRTLEAGDKVKEDWRPLNIEADFKPVLGTSLGTEKDPAEVRRVIFPGLVMFRPALAVGTYPDNTPGLITKALRVLNEKGGKNTEAKVLSPLARKIAGEGLDVFSDVSTPDQEKAKPKPAPEERARDTKEAEPLIPDHCLVRFIDVTVKPGYTYEYRVMIRVANPNFGKKTEVAWPALAEQRELASPWSDKPCRLTVPKELYAYGTELDDKALKLKQQIEPKLLTDKNDVTFMQVHRWIESTSLNPEQRSASVPVGDWSIGDVAVRRGEMIGRLENVKVPVWFPTKKAFEIAVPTQTATKPVGLGAKPPPVKGIPVNFATDDLLVDFEGGRIHQSFRISEKSTKDVREEANVEYLILGADGKLRLRNSRTDKADPERSEREKEWQTRVSNVESGVGRPAGDRPLMKDPFKKP